MKKCNLILILLIASVYYVLWGSIFWSEITKLIISPWQLYWVVLLSIIPIHYYVARYYLPTTPLRKIFWSVTKANIISLVVVLPVIFFLIFNIGTWIVSINDDEGLGFLFAIAIYVLIPFFYFLAVWTEKILLTKVFKISPNTSLIKRICWIGNLVPFAFIAFLHFVFVITLLRLGMSV